MSPKPSEPDPSSAAGFAAEGLACVRAGRRVFEGLSFALAPGDALLLRGANGSGKSTLLRCLAGLLRPAAGVLRRDGADIAEEPETHRSRLRYLGHHEAVKPQLSIAENLRFAAALAGISEPDIEAGLDAVGIGRLADLPARYLSAGQRRRLALARLVAAPAPLWLLDEPLSGLDAAAAARFAEMVAAQRQAGGMVVLSVHGPLELPGAAELDLGRFAPVYRAEPVA